MTILSFLDVDTLGEAVWSMLLLALAFILWPLVLLFLVAAMAVPWGSLERRRVAEIGAKLALVTAAWCGCVVAGAWWARGMGC